MFVYLFILLNFMYDIMCVRTLQSSTGYKWLQANSETPVLMTCPSQDFKKANVFFTVNPLLSLHMRTVCV